MIRTQPPMTEEQADHTDELYRARLRSLLSVDDEVLIAYPEVERSGVMLQTFLSFVAV